jgi:membrane protein YdbS with pleckstrin-like domain
MLDPNWPKADALSWWITVLVFLVPGLIAIPIVWLSAQPAAWLMLAVTAVWLSLIGLLVRGALRWPALEYRNTRYIVSPIGIEIRRGVLWRRVINVPRSRIQHTDVVQGPVMRRYQLATLVIHTAGTQDSTVTLAGLPHVTALQLRDYLIQHGCSTDTRSHDAV